jgi:hypothetical protein
MKTFAFILCSLLTTILLSNCGEQKITCAPDSHEYYYVKPEEKAVLPYKGFDTLKLKHSSGEEYTFYAGKMDSVFYINAKSTSPDCANNIFEHRQGFVIHFKHQVNTIYDIAYQMYIPSYYSSSTMVSVLFQKNKFEFDTDLYKFPSNNTNVFDSLNINGFFYYKVTKAVSKSSSNNYLLYNSNYGILKIVLSNGETFERIP